jgi:ATP-dependent helicase/DNAse subunit B
VAREIWLSPVLGKSRERLLARCADYLASGQIDRVLYVAASQPLLDLVTNRLLDGNHARGVWGEFPVYLFRGLVRRILSEAQASGRATHPTEPSPTVGLLTRVAIDREDLPLRKSLISQIVKQLSAAGQLNAIQPLANRDGCVNTIASLIGELQRAGKTSSEFSEAIAARANEAGEIQISKSKFQSSKSKGQTPTARIQTPTATAPKSQIDFDREVALIYEKYSAALDQSGLTDEDADQLRALRIMRGDIDHLAVSVAWLDQVELLVLDGFFDFTPVQGEILKYLVPRVPNVIVNVNHDEQNSQIFQPFAATIERLRSIADFDVSKIAVAHSGPTTSSRLGTRLFNAGENDSQEADEPYAQPPGEMRALLLECSDREIEIRSIAKEIKRLVLLENYQLSEIALVVRERAAYAEIIARVFAEQSIPGSLQLRVEAHQIPAMRACGKLFQLLKTPREEATNPQASELAHLIKTDYFRPTDESLEELGKQFKEKFSTLLDDKDDEKLRAALGIGAWKPDELENVIAYVGSQLPVNAWIDRARKLIRMFPSTEAAQALIAGAEAEDPAATAEDEAPQEDEAAIDRRKRPVPVHPASIAWTILIVRHLQQLLSAVPETGTLDELSRALLTLLNHLQFSNQVNAPFEKKGGANDIPQAILDVRGRESLRRAIAAAVRSFEYASQIVSAAGPSGKATSREPPSLAAGLLTPMFIDEVERCLRSQTLSVGTPQRDGLRVLEATDVRGLEFRAVFIAGMIEGGFPLRTSRDWLYPHEERLRLQKHGIFLEDISTDTLLKEEHYFYQAACRATDLLYLTRPLALNDGAETVPSYYIEELRRAMAPRTLEVKQIRGDLDAADPFSASSITELGPVLVRQAELERRNPGVPRSNVNQLLSRLSDAEYISTSALRRIEIEHTREAEWFGPYDGEINDADLQAMLAHHFGPDHVYSASRLSTYGNCAFRFFGNRVLRIEPRSEAALDLQAIDAGKLLHDVLRRFFEQHRGEYLPRADRQALREELAKTADEVFREHEDKMPPLNERIWKIDCEIRKLILDQVLLYELRLQEKTGGRVLPGYFELAFGRASEGSDRKSTKRFLKLERAHEAALIQGQIDRVDINEKEQLAIAYDYKLSKGATLDDIKSGRQVQIPIYLAALEELFLRDFDLGGGGYYTLRGKGSRLNQGLYRTAHADCTNVTSRYTKFDDLEWVRIRREVAARVWEFIDGMRSGRFRVKPSLGRHTCKFCDYSAVCRYDAYRINRKK